MVTVFMRMGIERLHDCRFLGLAHGRAVKPMGTTLVCTHQMFDREHILRRPPSHHLMREQHRFLEIAFDLPKVMQNRDDRAFLYLPLVLQTQLNFGGIGIHRVKWLIQ